MLNFSKFFTNVMEDINIHKENIYKLKEKSAHLNFCASVEVLCRVEM